MINKFTYLKNHTKFTDNIIHKKRYEILSHIKKELINNDFKDILDIGATADNSESSNLIIKNLKNYETYKSISNQKITSNLFSKKLKKSITEDFTSNQLEEYRSDVVISNATIEHVGNKKHQNVIKCCFENYK